MTLSRLFAGIEASIQKNRPLAGPGLRLEQTPSGRRLHLDATPDPPDPSAPTAAILARITGGGPGPIHDAELYPDGESQPPDNETVSIRILNLHADVTIPPDTWLLAFPSTDDTYLGQLPLWL